MKVMYLFPIFREVTTPRNVQSALQSSAAAGPCFRWNIDYHGDDFGNHDDDDDDFGNHDDDDVVWPCFTYNTFLQTWNNEHLTKKSCTEDIYSAVIHFLKEILQCGHCYCVDCIQILIKEYSQGKSTKCAVCRWSSFFYLCLILGETSLQNPPLKESRVGEIKHN